MKVFVNQQEYELENDFSLSQLMNQLTAHKNGVAVAVNNQVVTRACWSRCMLHDGDKVLVIAATCGG